MFYNEIFDWDSITGYRAEDDGEEDEAEEDDDDDAFSLLGSTHQAYGGVSALPVATQPGYGISLAPAAVAPAALTSTTLSYPSPAPTVPCGSNLLIGCSTNTQSVGCRSSPASSYGSAVSSY